MMFKKFFVPLMLALLAALLLGGVALAQTGGTIHGGRRGIGRILSLGDQQITIETRRGEQRDILVDDQTQYRTQEGHVLQFGDLRTGEWVAGIVRYNEQGQMVARLVLLLPDDYDPSQRLGRRAAGHVTSVDVQAGSFEMHTLRGDDLSFRVSEGTIYRGSVTGLEDLEEGMQAAVGGVKQDDGSLLALVVLARQPLLKHAGTVTSVDTSAGAFNLETRQGEALTFSVDDQTRFRSKDGSIQSLDDLESGMVAIVVADQGENGGLIARFVAAGTKDQLPQFDLRTAGRVVVVNADGFILQSPSGEQYKFVVTGETKFRSLGGWLQGLGDIQIGMRLGVGGDELGGGGYVARLVLGSRPR
jgi:hypothetical protein